MAEYQVSDLTVNIDFECHVDGDKTKELVKYQATVVFSSLAKLLEAGGDSVRLKCQTKARGGKFPVGRRVTVDETGKFALTSEEKINAAVVDATDDEAEEMMRLLLARKAAKAAQELKDTPPVEPAKKAANKK